MSAWATSNASPNPRVRRMRGDCDDNGNQAAGDKLLAPDAPPPKPGAHVIGR